MTKFCFDCDDTLYDSQASFRKSIDKIGLNINMDLSAFFKIYRKMGDRIFELEHNHIITTDDVGIYRIYAACKELGIPLSLEQAADFQDNYKYFQNHITMHPILHKFFSTTSSEIAILTNGQEEYQKKKVRTLGMYDYIDDSSVYSSEGIGYSKPDIQAFQTLAYKFNSDVSEWYYIGDNYVKDMEGAKNAGMHTIHMNRHHNDEGPMSDYVVYSEEELVSLLKKIESNQ